MRRVAAQVVSQLVVTASTSAVSVTADVPSFAAATALNTSGAVTVVPFSQSFASALTWPMTNLTLSNTVSGLTLGKSGNASNITLGSATTVAGPIRVYGNNVSVNAALTATNSTVYLYASGTVSDGASGYITADKLALVGGSVTLDNTSNSVNTLAANGVGALTYVNAGALTVGTVNPTGITATGDVRVETLSGDLTIEQNVTTTSTTANAVLLNAGKSTSAGTATGGNIRIVGTPTLTAGTGGTIRLMSGSVSGSTGLTALVGSGSGRFRYNSDEVTGGNNYTLALSPNVVNAIYREQPTATANIDNYTVTYGYDDTTTLSSLKPDGSSALSTSRVAVNGDESVTGLGVIIEGARYSTGNKLNYRATPYTLTDGLAKLGYATSQTGGSLLTVEKKSIDLVGFRVENKAYDGNITATFSGAVTFTAIETNDAVSYTSATGTQETVSSPGSESKRVAEGSSATSVEMTIERTREGMGVKWLRTVHNYHVATVRDTLRDALTSPFKGLKVIVAEGECQLERQRRLKPLRALRLKQGLRSVRTRYGVDEDTCTGDHSCIRLSGCPTLTIKDSTDPLKSAPVAHVTNGCVGCGLCGEVADAAVLCPSFHKIEIVSNPGWWDRVCARFNQWAIRQLQA